MQILLEKKHQEEQDKNKNRYLTVFFCYFDINTLLKKSLIISYRYEVIIILLILYPKCSTCIKAKKYLENKNVKFKVRDIVLNTPTESELLEIIKKSKKEIRKFFNTSGIKYKELGLKEKLNNMSENEMIKLLASDGMLIKRPILVCEDSVLIGFREKEWSEII